MKQKTPKPIIALAIVNAKNPKLDVLELFRKDDLVLRNKEEKMCIVEISFKKYIK